jgi:SAM-dependent methyltransferase
VSSRRAHWESIYRDRDPSQVSWFQENPARSLILIEETGVSADAPIIDIGGGTSRLVDRLLGLGYLGLTVLDVAPTALGHARERLGVRARDVVWIDADVLEHPFENRYAVWHDRAVFHFLTEPDERAAYAAQLRSAVVAGGHVIIATSGPDGPERCSGLPVQRHDAETMAEAIGPAFEPVGFQAEAHHTPSGGLQHFLYGRFRRRPAD